MPVSHFRDGVPGTDIRRKYLRNGSGSNHMGVDGSTTPVEFKLVAPEGENILMLGLTISLMDSFVYPNKFGNLDALENGCLLTLKDSSDVVQLDMCDNEPIRINADFAAIDSGISNRLAGSGTSLLTMSWIAQGDDEPLIVPDGSYISMLIQDDLGTIDYFRALVKGRLYNAAA